MIKNKKRGFTLVEMIIVMSLSIIVITAIFSFFIISKKISSQTEIKSDMQREAAKVQQSIIDIGTQSEKLIYVKTAGDEEINYFSDYKDKATATSTPDVPVGTLAVKEFAFKYPKGYGACGINIDNNSDYLHFEYKLNTDNKLICKVYKESDPSNVKNITVCENVDSISIKPVNWGKLSDSQNFCDNTTGLKLTINFKISRGFYTGDKAQKQSINAIIKFRNNDVS